MSGSITLVVRNPDGETQCRVGSVGLLDYFTRSKRFVENDSRYFHHFVSQFDRFHRNGERVSMTPHDAGIVFIDRDNLVVLASQDYASIDSVSSYAFTIETRAWLQEAERRTKGLPADAIFDLSICCLDWTDSKKCEPLMQWLFENKDYLEKEAQLFSILPVEFAWFASQRRVKFNQHISFWGGLNPFAKLSYGQLLSDAGQNASAFLAFFYATRALHSKRPVPIDLTFKLNLNPWKIEQYAPYSATSMQLLQNRLEAFNFHLWPSEDEAWQAWINKLQT